MNAQLALKEKLLASQAVTSFVGNRVTPISAGQDQHGAYITFQRVDGVHEHNLTQASGLVMVRVQLNIYADSYVTVHQLAEAVRLCLDTFPQRDSEIVTVNGVQVRVGMCNLQTDRDGYEEPTAGQNRGRFQVIQDYLVGQYESVPPNNVGV